MRLGSNPQKQESETTLATHHRIVMVVYIPNEQGFYTNSFEVFKMCLDSIVNTINLNVAVTIVNNGSHKKVSDLLISYLEEKKIDTLMSHNKNIGKIDAMIGAARGAREKYITLTDADILFVKGWQEKVEEIFLNFVNVGSVSPIPIRTGLYSGTSTVLRYILFRKIKFKFVPIPENFINYNKFLESINWDLETQDDKLWPVVEKNGIKAIIGSAHQVLTIDRDILFLTSPSNPSLTLVGNNSEHNYVDVPIDKAGKLRLATYNNYAYHMGNKLENWMIDVQKTYDLASSNIKNHSISVNPSSDLFNSIIKDKWYGLKKMILKKMFFLFIEKNSKAL